MRSASDHVQDLLGRSEAKTILEALDTPTAENMIRGLDRETRRDIAQILTVKTIERIEANQTELHQTLSGLKTEHDAIMSGEKAPCRAVERIQTRFWKFIAISMALPIILMLIGMQLKKSMAGPKPNQPAQTERVVP